MVEPFLLRCIVLGPPGSGKGALTSRLAVYFNLPHICTRDALQKQIKNETPIGIEAVNYIHKGILIPDDIMVKFIIDELSKVPKNQWIMDGFPRTIYQAKTFWNHQPVNVVLNLQIPFYAIIDKLKGRWIHMPSGRVYDQSNVPKVPGVDDVTGEALIQRRIDRPNILLERLKDYELKTYPIIEFYRNKGVLKNFKAKSVSDVGSKINDYISKFIPSNV